MNFMVNYWRQIGARRVSAIAIAVVGVYLVLFGVFGLYQGPVGVHGSMFDRDALLGQTAESYTLSRGENYWTGRKLYDGVLGSYIEDAPYKALTREEAKFVTERQTVLWHFNRDRIISAVVGLMLLNLALLLWFFEPGAIRSEMECRRMILCMASLGYGQEPLEPCEGGDDSEGVSSPASSQATVPSQKDCATPPVSVQGQEPAAAPPTATTNKDEHQSSQGMVDVFGVTEFYGGSKMVVNPDLQGRLVEAHFHKNADGSHSGYVRLQ